MIKSSNHSRTRALTVEVHKTGQPDKMLGGGSNLWLTGIQSRSGEDTYNNSWNWAKNCRHRWRVTWFLRYLGLYEIGWGGWPAWPRWPGCNLSRNNVHCKLKNLVARVNTRVAICENIILLAILHCCATNYEKISVCRITSSTSLKRWIHFSRARKAVNAFEQALLSLFLVCREPCANITCFPFATDCTGKKDLYKLFVLTAVVSFWKKG